MIGRTNAGAGGTAGGTLTVTAPAGVTVTVSKDGKTKTKTADSSGVAVFKGLASGTWTVTITDGTQTTSTPVVITVDYSTTMAFFSATINVTYPAGSTCTATDGTTTLTAPDTSGTWTCVVPNSGTWTISCTSDDESTSDVVIITSNGQSASVELSYALYLINGSDQCNDVTGGFVCAALSLSGNSSITTPTIRASDSQTMIYAKGAGSSGVYYGYLVRTANKIDVTKYDKLQLTGSTTRTIYVKLWSDIGASGNANNAASAKMESDTTTTIDLSSLTGSYYIGFAGEVSGRNECTALVDALYLA